MIHNRNLQRFSSHQHPKPDAQRTQGFFSLQRSSSPLVEVEEPFTDASPGARGTVPNRWSICGNVNANQQLSSFRWCRVWCRFTAFQKRERGTTLQA